MTPYSLYNVERRGVQLRREISSKNRDFQAVLRLKQPDANSALIKWLNSSKKSDIRPTWRNLLLVLRLVNLDKVAEAIESFLGKETTYPSFERDPKGECQEFIPLYVLSHACKALHTHVCKLTL